MELNPLNDKIVRFALTSINPTTGVESAITAGTTSVIIATTDAPTATEADPSLAFTAIHIGGANGFASGLWQVAIDGALLTVALLASLPRYLYLVAIRTDEIRVVARLDNVASRYAQVGS